MKAMRFTYEEDNLLNILPLLVDYCKEINADVETVYEGIFRHLAEFGPSDEYRALALVEDDKMLGFICLAQREMDDGNRCVWVHHIYSAINGVWEYLFRFADAWARDLQLDAICGIVYNRFEERAKLFDAKIYAAILRKEVDHGRNIRKRA